MFSPADLENGVCARSESLGESARVDDCRPVDVTDKVVEVGGQEEDVRWLLQQGEIFEFLNVEVYILAWRIERVEAALLEDV